MEYVVQKWLCLELGGVSYDEADSAHCAAVLAEEALENGCVKVVIEQSHVYGEG